MTVWLYLQRLLAPALAALVLVVSTASCIIDYQLSSEPQAVTVHVQADRAWTDTYLDVTSGDWLVIDYRGGTWSPWPGGFYDALGFGGDPRCDCNRLLGVSHAALIARLGDNEPFFVGDHWAQAVGEGGRLFLGINDTRLDDNTGWLEIRVTTES